jgi:sec-independent protein translocase protein TatA
MGCSINKGNFRHNKPRRTYKKGIGGICMFEGLLQPMHLIIILVIVLIIFGPGKLPELGGSIGKAIRGFKQAMNEPENKQEEDAKKISH